MENFKQTDTQPCSAFALFYTYLSTTHLLTTRPRRENAPPFAQKALKRLLLIRNAALGAPSYATVRVDQVGVSAVTIDHSKFRFEGKHVVGH